MRRTIGETEYYYTINGEGEPVVLLHGFTGTTRTWASLEDKLIQSGFQVICVDLLGHGRTRTDSLEHTMESVCRDIKNILQAHGIEQCSLVGYSQGGRVALSFAQYYPHIVHKLVLESASPGIEQEEERQKRKQNDNELAHRLLTEGLESFVLRWEKTPLFATQSGLAESVKEGIRNERLSQTAEGLALALQTIGTGVQPSWWNHLQKTKASCLLIVGEKDKKFVQLNKAMNELLMYSTIEIVDGCGHAVHIEKPKKFNQVVLDFLQE